jgi:hypothetical protein
MEAPDHLQGPPRTAKAAPLAGLWLAALILFCFGPATAEPPGGALHLYIAGDFLAAASAAQAQPSASNQAFAARALMAACLTSDDRSQTEALLDRAEAAARDALRLDPNSVEGRLQLALAMGVRARQANIAEAIAHNYAPRGRRLILEALARDPGNPWAHELLGAWNLEVLRRGGSAGAAAYGARLSTGIAEFERARSLAPDEPMIALHYAVALIELDHDRYADQARQLLSVATSATPHDAFEAHALAQARELEAVLRRDGPQAADAEARRAFL